MGEFFILYATLAAILGAILGSFLNVLSFRFNTGRSWVSGRSRCMHCGHALLARDLVPLFSYIFLKGRCRYCGARISLQYPLVEAAAGMLAVFIYLIHQEPLGFFFWLFVWMALLFVVIYDLRHAIIPSTFSILLAVLALIHVSTLGFDIWSLAAGPLLALPLFLISLISGGRWMGWGDSALELSLGWFLGLTAGLTAFMLAFWSGALVGIALLLLKKGFKMKSEIPFAPFLVFGAFVAYFFHVDLFSSLPYFW
jgi:leader peptidase (prepilin peptidase)/N-methyltransferase